MGEMPSVLDHSRDKAWRELRKDDETHKAGKENPKRDAASRAINRPGRPSRRVTERKKQLGQ